MNALSAEALAAGSAIHNSKASEVAACIQKRNYPHAVVVPFITEDHGCFVTEALELIQHVAPIALLQRKAADAMLSAVTARLTQETSKPKTMTSRSAHARTLIDPAAYFRLHTTAAF